MGNKRNTHSNTQLQGLRVREKRERGGTQNRENGRFERQRVYIKVNRDTEKGDCNIKRRNKVKGD